MSSIPQNAGRSQCGAIIAGESMVYHPADIARQQAVAGYAAELGWCVIPAWGVFRLRHGPHAGQMRCRCRRAERCGTMGKHPRLPEWNPQAIPSAPSVAQVEAWWRDHPENNVCVLTGSRSRLVVADIDTHDGGNLTARLDGLLAAGWTLDTCIARTGGGGLHVYARMPDRLDVVASIPHYLPGIELKADGGLVIAPPSDHPSGRPYAWATEHEPAVFPPASLPDAVWDAILAHRPAVGRRRGVREAVDTDGSAQPATSGRHATPPGDTTDLTPRQRDRLARRAPSYVDRAIARARQGLDGGRNNTGKWLVRQLHSLRLSQADAWMYMRQYQREVEHG